MNKPLKTNKTSADTDIQWDASFTADVSAERALVATLLDSPKLMPDALEMLGSSDLLTDEAYKILFDTLCSLYDDGKTIKLGTVLQRLNANGTASKLLQMGISLIGLPAEAKSSELADTCSHLRGLWSSVRPLNRPAAFFPAFGQVIQLIKLSRL